MGAEVSRSVFSELARNDVGRRVPRRSRLPVVPARGGDHTAIHFFLSSIFQGPTPEEFAASLEDPFYEPSDRLLVRRGRRIIGHVHLTHRAMQFGTMQLAVAGLGYLATAPEYRGRHLGLRLLAAAEQAMSQSGASVGLLRTTCPHFFRRTGWALCGRPCVSRAPIGDMLSRLIDAPSRKRPLPGLPLLGPPRRRLKIRPWRRWEQPALARVHYQNLPGTFGTLDRTDAYWNWLVNRQAHDQIYVALDGPNLLELGEVSTRIVGYAVTQGEAVVELLTAPDRRDAATELLVRIGGDAIEQGRHGVVLHAPSDSPLHELFPRAAGNQTHHAAYRGEVHMARLLDPLTMLRQLCPEFHARAERAGLARPLELGLLADGKKYRLEVTRQGARAVSRRLGRNYLCLNVADFTRLMLGQLDWDEAVDGRRVEASSAAAMEAAPILFPRLPLWLPPWDAL